MRYIFTPAAVLAVAGCLSAGQAFGADIYKGDSGASYKDAPAPFAAYGIYLAVRGGAAFAQNTDFDFDALSVNVENQYEDNGYFVSGAIGKSLTGMTGIGGLRGELEVGTFGSDIDAHNVGGALFEGDDAFGTTSGLFGLVNIFYDFNQFGRFKPFIGGGIGLARVEFDGHGVNLGGTDTVVMDDEDTGFAYQLSAGANIALTDTVDLELGYRYLGVTGLELEAVDSTVSDVDVDNHIIYGGLRFKM